MSLRREIIRAQVDVPVVVQLGQDVYGKEAPSRFGAQRALLVNNGAATLYLDQQHWEVLWRSGARSGDSVELRKTLYKNMPTYDVCTVSDAAEPAGPRVVAPRPAYANGTNGHTQAAAAPPASSHLAHCLRAAIDAALEAQEYARAKNLGVTFLGSDIRAMANSLLIGDQQNGGAR